MNALATRPTYRAVILFAAGVPLSLGLILLNERLWPFSLAYLVLAIVVTGTDGMRCLPARRMTVDVTPPPLLYIGDKDVLQVVLSAPAGWADTHVEIACDTGAILEPPPLHRAALAAGGSTTIAIPLVATKRGAAEIERLWLRWPGPLGLMRRQRIETLSASVPVVPNVRAVRQAAVLFSARNALFGIKPEYQQGEGSEFDSLRDYVPGLDHRSVDWKHSARHRKLVCKEFRAERNHQIVLAFDTGHLMSEPLEGISKLDHAINAGLLLAYMSLRSGDQIGMFGFDARVRMSMPPVGGVHQFARLQQASADLNYQHEETNFTLGLVDLLSRLNRRSLVILQTEFVDTITAELMVENLARLASRHLVVFVTLQDTGLHKIAGARPHSVADMTQAVIADDLIRERAVVFERLRRLGVHCLQAPGPRLGIDLLNQYLAIKRKELI